MPVLATKILKSSHRCVGDHGRMPPQFDLPNVSLWEDYSLTSCSFHNVCIQTDEQGEFFPQQVATILYYVGDQGESPFPDHFQMGRLKWDASNAHATVQTVPSEFPQKEPNVKIMSGLISEWCSSNLGHYLLEHLLPHYLMNRRFGYGEPRDFQLVSTNPVSPNSLDPSFGVAFSSHRMVPLQTLSRNDHRGRVCFDTLNVGMTTRLRTPIYGDTIFQYQQFLLKGFGLPLKKRSSGNLVVMGVKAGKPGVKEHVGGRHYYDATSNKEYLSKRLQNFRMEPFFELSALEQVKLMQETAVFVTPGGGLSFIGMFLPIGSVIITLDIYDYGAKKSQPFATENHFWNNCAWLKVWRYPVTPEEYYCQEGEEFCRKYYYLGNYDLNMTRLSQFIELALKESSSDFGFQL
jgi:hypothetical protein